VISRRTRSTRIIGLLLVLAVLSLAACVTNEEDEPSLASPASSRPLSSPTIPGLTAADVTGNLERRGLDCTGIRIESGGTATWFCSGSAGQVTVRGTSPTRIRAVNAAAFGSDRQAADFLGFVATVPYDGAQPQSARAWVESQVASGGSTSFGGARFQLGGPAQARWLDIIAQ